MSAITITTSGHNLLRDGTTGSQNPKITYVALGTSNTAPSASDTKLGAESYRKAVTSTTNGANPGEVLINMYLAPGDDLSDAIQEIGFFGGNATNTPNSGTLLARGLYSHTRPATALESIQFQLDLTV
jgi:hypothetical protein